MYFFISTILTLAELLTQENNFSSSSLVPSAGNTVHYVCTDFYRYKEKNGKISSYKEEREGAVKLEVVNLEDNNRMLLSDTRSIEQGNFFFTTSKMGTYAIKISLEDVDYNSIEAKWGVEVKIFMGEGNKPAIISTGDVELSKADELIGNILEYANNNLVIQNMGYEDDKEYKSMYDGILKIAFAMVIFKIIASAATVVYSNLRTKQIFSDQKISSKE